VGNVREPEANVVDGTHQDGRVVARGNEPPALPVALGLRVDRPDDDGAAADDVRPGEAAVQGILDQPATDTARPVWF